jgi:hypothetical protein
MRRHFPSASLFGNPVERGGNYFHFVPALALTGIATSEYVPEMKKQVA